MDCHSALYRLKQRAVCKEKLSLSVVATAAEDDHDGKNYDPGTVVVEKIAKTVIIHICFPPSAFWVRPIIIVCNMKKKCHKNIAKKIHFIKY